MIAHLFINKAGSEARFDLDIPTLEADCIQLVLEGGAWRLTPNQAEHLAAVLIHAAKSARDYK